MPPKMGRSLLAFHLCAFEPAGGRWTVLQTINPEANPYNNGSGNYYNGDNSFEMNRELLQQSGRPRVSVGEGTVTFSLGIAGAGDDAAAYQWDRKSKKLQPISWDLGLRADNRTLFSTSLVTDAKTGDLWLGTNVGLLHRPAAGGSSSDARWTRLLADQMVGEAAAHSDGGVSVITTLRQTRGGSYRPSDPVRRWKLFRVTGTSDAAIKDETPPPSKQETGTSGPMMGNPFAATSPNETVPIAVSFDDSGALWLTQRGANRYNLGGSGGIPRAGLDSWWQRKVGDSGWTRFEQRYPNGPGFSMTQPPSLRQTTASGETHNNVSISLLSDAAVRPLAIFPLQTNNYGYAVSSGGSVVGGRQDDPQVTYWLRRRFPAWVCADDLAEKMKTPPGTDPFPRMASSAYGLFPDPFDANGKLWMLDKAGTTLLHLAKADVPEDLMLARTRGYYQTSPVPDTPTNPKIEKYALPGGGKIHIRPNIDALIAGGKNLFLAIGSRELQVFNTTDGTFSRVPLQGNGIFPSRHNPPVATTDGGVLISSPNSSESQVTSYKPGDGSFRVLATPPVGSRVFGVAPNGGLWIAANSFQIYFQAPGQETATPLPADIRISRNASPPPVAATDYIAWYNAEGDVLAGYDIERKRATPSITVRNPRGYGRVLKVIGDGRGGAYTASDNETASAYHYSRDRNSWEIAAPPLPAVPVNPRESSIRLAPVIISGSDREIWLLADARYLIRYNRQRKSWDAPLPLPLSIRGGNSSDNDLSAVPGEGGKAIYVAGRGGLWRYGIAEKRWTEKRMPVTIPSPDVASTNPRRSSGTPRLLALAPSPKSVFTVWNLDLGGTNFAARLDRQTRKWTIYDESKGFPERNTGMRLIGGGTGSSAWAILGNETYFFDATRDLWRLAFGRPADGPSQIGEQVPTVAVEQGKAAQTEDTGDFRVADIVVDPKTGDSFVLANPQNYTGESRSVVFRCDGSGKIIARSETPLEQGSPGAMGYSLLADKGSVLVASSKGVYRAFGADSTVWSPVASPPGVTLPGSVTRLYREPGGTGLYVGNSDTVAFWQQK